ncbi:MAG: response regulator [Candidatus Doudnabacteria bacterium]|nr:response regulator [Candidatus Doudnabacteria bacterium]
MKHSILIVDDDKLILNTLEKRFSSFDVSVKTARTAEETLEILKSFTPELVLLDLLLTTEDGSMQILEYLKGQPGLADVPVVILTNLDKPDLREAFLQKGVKEFLAKGALSLDEIYNHAMSYLEPSK